MIWAYKFCVISRISGKSARWWGFSERFFLLYSLWLIVVDWVWVIPWKLGLNLWFNHRLTLQSVGFCLWYQNWGRHLKILHRMTVIARLNIALVLWLKLFPFPWHFLRINTASHLLIWLLTKLHSLKHLFKCNPPLSLFNHFLIHAFVVVFVLPAFLFYIPCLLCKLRRLLYLLLGLC